jgi:hypothetical protein
VPRPFWKGRGASALQRNALRWKIETNYASLKINS